MATDFSYNGKTINAGGPIKPSGKNQPLDPRTEVKLYADIESIPNPYIGMIITVLEDETNSNKMTDYKVLSLKADSLGVANSVVDQVQRYVNYLGAGSVSQEDIKAAVNDYFEKNPIQSGTIVFTDITTDEAFNYNGTAEAVEVYGNIIVNNANVLVDAGSTTNFTVKLGKAPTNAQAVNLISDNSDITLTPSSISFTPENYSEPKTITVTASSTAVAGATINVGSSGTPTIFVTVTLRNPPVVGNMIVNPNSLNMNKNSSSSFNVTLDKAPTNAQTISIVSDNDSITVNPSSLTFTSENYSEPKIITVTTASITTNGIISLTSKGVESVNVSISINKELPSNGFTTITDGLVHAYNLKNITSHTVEDAIGDNDMIINSAFAEGINFGNEIGGLYINKGNGTSSISKETAKISDLNIVGSYSYVLSLKLNVDSPTGLIGKGGVSAPQLVSWGNNNQIGSYLYSSTVKTTTNIRNNTNAVIGISVDIEKLVSAVFANGGYNTTAITDIAKDGGLTTLTTDGYMLSRNFCTLYELLIYNRPLTEDEFTIIKNELDLNRN
nr:MAG TPA: hypothetical protein [Caudoviricetes sp.]